MTDNVNVVGFCQTTVRRAEGYLSRYTQASLFLHGASNSPINEWVKAHALWHTGYVRAVSAERAD